MLRPGRKIWIVDKVDSPGGPIEFKVGPLRITKFRRFLPAGEYEKHSHVTGTTELSNRKRSLVQVFTDPGGLRTVAVATIWGKEPGKSNTQW